MFHRASSRIIASGRRGFTSASASVNSSHNLVAFTVSSSGSSNDSTFKFLVSLLCLWDCAAHLLRFDCIFGLLFQGALGVTAIVSAALMSRQPASCEDRPKEFDPSWFRDQASKPLLSILRKSFFILSFLVAYKNKTHSQNS